MSLFKQLLCVFLIACAFLHAQDNPSHPKELSAVQQEIDQLEQKIHRLRLKSIGAELKGNEYMYTEWGRYADQIEQSESYDLDIMKLEKELEQLESTKRDLLIQYKGQQHES